ncbi:hypothetical protein F2Q69_00042366 [Brassica cretica]|uniref:Uncharacterized protein n=1 Tax=Brassica cretica TaxID=69181 RepID=A0A8S9NGN7_BRACR|nr:hypothetical protein F2Q69_00042366 [Brassica cretica]
MTVMALGYSTGRRRMNMEYTEMIMDMAEMSMDTSSVYPKIISEVFWKELQVMSTSTYVFKSMLGHSHRPSYYQRSTPRMKSMRCSMESVEPKNRMKVTSR